MSLRHQLAAYAELLGRYRQVFLHFWRQRKFLDSAGYTAEEAEFLPAALAVQEAPVSNTARLTAGLLIGLVWIFLIWSAVGKVDIVTTANGKIIPSSRIKSIASVETASVKALHVVEGQFVRRGEILVELDTSASDAERDKASGDQGQAVLQGVRARAMIVAIDNRRAPQWPPLPALQRSVPGLSHDQWLSERSHLESWYRDYSAKLKRANDDIQRYAELLPLAVQKADDYKSLLQQHDVPQHAWLEKEQARIELQGQLADAQNQRATLVAETRNTAFDQLTESDKLAASSKQDAFRSASRSRQLILTAPVDGTVQQLTAHTVGGVVPAAQPLMQIVPAAHAIEVEASIDSKDIGFVLEGARAEVKIDAFEYSKYGTIAATVTSLSRDAVQDEKRGLLYGVKVTLERSTLTVEGKKLPLSPGMSVSVDIKTGERRIIEYFLSPLLQHQRESLRER